ncbi:MAG: glycosyltransferase family 2 protein [Iamia sp.]
MGTEAAAGAFSFVVPVYDEADGIDRTWAIVRRTGEAMAGAGVIGCWEAVFVDDGSTDGTSGLLDDFAARDERLRVVHHGANRGVGAAMRTGLAAAGGDLVLYTDADLPFDLGLVPALVEELRDSGSDLLSAVRRGRRGESTTGAVRSWIYNVLVRLVFHLPVHDVNFACKLATRRALAPARWHSESPFIDVEWLVWAHRTGCRIVQPGVEYRRRDRGASSMGGLRVVVLMLADLVRFHRRLRRSRGVPIIDAFS